VQKNQPDAIKRAMRHPSNRHWVLIWFGYVEIVIFLLLMRKPTFFYRFGVMFLLGLALGVWTYAAKSRASKSGEEQWPPL
jgi:hypothetical protein